MTALIAALVYANGIYPERVIARAVERLRDRGVPMAGALQCTILDTVDRHPCDLLIEDLTTGDVTPIAEHRGRQARGCKLDVGLLTELAHGVVTGVRSGTARLLVINKFGKTEAEGGGLRDAIAEAVGRDIPVLVGVPMRNLDQFRAFAGPLAVELPVNEAALAGWLAEQGLLGPRSGSGAADRATPA